MPRISLRKHILSSLVFLSFLLVYSEIPAQTVSESETAGGIQKQEENLEKMQRLEQKITEKKKKPEIEEKEEGPAPLPEGEKVFIKKITVEGTTLLSEAEITKIISQFQGKELTLADMQKVADLITDALRKKGYATSRAYLPPQTIAKDGILKIKVVEGKVGEINIKGNRYFKTALYKKKLKLQPGEYFAYPSLQRSLVSINENPDRLAKAILAPGKKPGTTDIILEVKDKLPIHVGYEYDNFAARSLGRDRQAVVFEHNNLLGFDDKLYFKFQRSEDSLYTSKSARYLFPVDDTLELGLTGLYSRSRLGREFSILDSRGTAMIIGAFMNKALIAKDNLDLRLNFGFDYKKIRNYLLGGIEISRDDVRVFKLGFDLDAIDKWGRNILTAELDGGVPRMWGGLLDKDPRASRVGAGGKFFKGAFNFFRLQPMPFSSTILWKNTAQLSNYTLVAAEQFQIGGPLSVRGYPPAEFSGDGGISTSLEWTFPFYFIPKKINVPFTKEKVYDRLRVALFYDWATVHLNKIQPGDKKYRVLKAAGFGFRFNIIERLSAKVDFGYPLDKNPSDKDHLHTWVEFTCKI